MSKEYEGKSPLDIAAEAERDLNSSAAKTGAKVGGVSDSSEFPARFLISLSLIC